MLGQCRSLLILNCTPGAYQHPHLMTYSIQIWHDSTSRAGEVFGDQLHYLTKSKGPSFFCSV